MNIGKEFRWEMGHRLPFHTRGCQNMHGHSYRLIVEMEGEPGPTGMVADYTDLKEIVKPLVDRLDHAFMCDATDAAVCAFLEQNGMKAVNVPFATTAENIALYILHHITEAIETARKHTGVWNAVRNVRVRLCETESTYADCEAAL
ncbi:MAG: 6-pyruvoyl trahydropterin synthase family protein [Acidobacteriota bacterium]